MPTQINSNYTLNAENFKKGLALMDKFPAWFANLHDDRAAGKLDTPTKLNFAESYCLREAEKAVLKFVFDEISAGEIIDDLLNLAAH